MVSAINTGQGCPEAYLPWNRGGNMQSVWRKVWFKFCWNMRSFFGNAQFFRALETYLCYCINKVLKLVLRKSTISFEWNSLPSKMKCVVFIRSSNDRTKTLDIHLATNIHLAKKSQILNWLTRESASFLYPCMLCW